MSSTTSARPLSVLILGTCDTKLTELLYLRSRILAHAPEASVTLIDISTKNPPSHPLITIPQSDLCRRYHQSHSADPPDLSGLSRSETISIVTGSATACLSDLVHNTATHGIVALGGSSGTSLASTAVRRAAPFLFPKLIVSTVASGDTAPYVGETDITMMYSIVDIAGSNSILDAVLDNAAGSIVGMSRAYQHRQSPRETKPDGSHAGGKKNGKRKIRVGITMFGVTTPCVDAIRGYLASPASSRSQGDSYEFEVFVFHATGRGGNAMERLVSAKELDAVIDLTLTEIADFIVGGVMSAGQDRLSAAAKAGIPQVVSLGACEVVNFGPRSTVPVKFEEEGRRMYEHNSGVTLVRTNKEEARRIGDFVAEKLRGCVRKDVVEVVMPTGGLSALSETGGVYEDREADQCLFEAVEEGLQGTGVEAIRDERDINDDTFARDVAEKLVRLIGKGENVGQWG
ncbi:MAG: hypothetical protein Q9208_007032 [Pyrenodesmia sp. 3 TL-2023]